MYWRDVRFIKIFASFVVLLLVSILSVEWVLESAGVSEDTIRIARKIVKPLSPGLMIGLVVFACHGYINELTRAGARFRDKIAILSIMAAPFVLCYFGPLVTDGTVFESLVNKVCAFFGRAREDLGGIVLGWFAQILLIWRLRSAGYCCDSVWQFLRSERIDLSVRHAILAMTAICCLIAFVVAFPSWFDGLGAASCVTKFKECYNKLGYIALIPLLMWEALGFIRGLF